MRKELYYFRDQQGLIASKASKTLRPAMAAPLLSLQRSLSKRIARLMVVHRKPHSSFSTAAIAPGAEAVDINQFVQELNRSQ